MSFLGDYADVISKACLDGDSFTISGACIGTLLITGIDLFINFITIFVKLPQILKILENKNADGINKYGIFAELLSVTIASSFYFVVGFNAWSWTKGFILLMQMVIISITVLLYNNRIWKFYTFVLLYSFLIYLLYVSGMSYILHLYLQLLVIPLNLVSKILQIITNFRNKGTGQLSGLSYLIAFSSSIGFSFLNLGTTKVAVVHSILGFTNFIILIQIISHDKAKEGKDKKE